MLWKRWIRKPWRVGESGGSVIAVPPTAGATVHVVCHCRVSLNMGTRSMQGTIPHSIGNLTALTYEAFLQCVVWRRRMSYDQSAAASVLWHRDISFDYITDVAQYCMFLYRNVRLPVSFYDF